MDMESIHIDFLSADVNRHSITEVVNLKVSPYLGIIQDIDGVIKGSIEDSYSYELKPMEGVISPSKQVLRFTYHNSHKTGRIVISLDLFRCCFKWQIQN